MFFKRKKGLTFVEVMLTIMILSTGLVMVQKSFLISLGYQNHLIVRLYAMNLMEHQISVLQRHFSDNRIFPLDMNGMKYNVILNNKKIAYQMDFEIKTISDLDDLFLVDITVTWKENLRLFSINRTTYISALL